jgi:hypothetical protein
MSLEKLRDDLVHAGVRCKYSKARIIVTTLWRSCISSVHRRKSWRDLEAMFLPEQHEATAGALDFLSRCAIQH